MTNKENNEVSKAASQMRKKFLASISPEERRERARKAWEASAKARKERKLLTPPTGHTNVGSDMIKE